MELSVYIVRVKVAAQSEGEVTWDPTELRTGCLSDPAVAAAPLLVEED